MIISLGTSIVSAQTPNVQVFFEGGTAHLPECPPDMPGTVLGHMYVVASNFNMWIAAIEYGTSFPPQLNVLGMTTGGLDIIEPPFAGVATSWPFPINGFSPVVVNDITFIYNCQLCFETDIQVVLGPHPVTGFVRAVQWPDNTIVNGVGLVSTICSTIPTEDTTWGSIKALYH
jgi:hypothetical protein